MNDLLSDIENFFQVNKELFGNTLFLDQKIADTEQLISEPESSEDTKNELSEESDAFTQFYNQVKDCKKCSLSSTRTNFVFGEGNPKADIVFVGEAPGREEDLKGVPFVGKAGQLLTLMLMSINIKRKDVYIANVLKCRPPNNRDPLPDEIESCEPFLLKQISLISPKLIVALGRFAAATLLRKNAALTELREVEHQYNNVPLIVTFHPSALLRNPQWKKQAWEDLKKIRKYL